MMRWYCVYTKPGAELWARSNLWERNFEVYLPRYCRRRRHARRTEFIAAPLFSRYLFVSADLEAGAAGAILCAPGVANLVSFGGLAAPVPPAVIEQIRAHEGSDGLVDIDRGLGPASRYKPGDRVRIEEGAMRDVVGLFHAHTADQRVFILLELLGRQIRVRVNADALARED